MKRTVIIADDHELMREGICALLERSGEFKILAAVGDGQSALAELEAHHPDIAIVDASMPMQTGVEVLVEAASKSPDTRLILISMFDHIHLIAEAAGAGAAACVSKNDAAKDLLTAIQSLDSGEFFVSRSMAEEWEKIREADPFIPLSVREREVMQAIVNGASNKEIADQLGLSVRTVDHHRERMMRKIGARNAADVVRYAAQKGEV